MEGTPGRIFRQLRARYHAVFVILLSQLLFVASLRAPRSGLVPGRLQKTENVTPPEISAIRTVAVFEQGFIDFSSPGYR